MTNSQARALEDKMSDSRVRGNPYIPNEATVQKWAGLRASEYTPQYYKGRTVESLLPLFDGKGIGGTREVPSSFHEGVFAGIRDGLFRLVSYRDYCGNPRSYEEFLTLELTEKGMRFFDAIPRMALAEVWG